MHQNMVMLLPAPKKPCSQLGQISVHGNALHGVETLRRKRDKVKCCVSVCKLTSHLRTEKNPKLNRKVIP